MNEIVEKINDSYLLGCIKYQKKYRFYLMPVAYWILNYSKYDPTYNPKDWEYSFRNDILNVTELENENYLAAISGDEIFFDEENFRKYMLKDIFFFFIDFDSKLYVNFFDDIDLEEYLPDENWKGQYSDPINCLPNEIIKKII